MQDGTDFVQSDEGITNWFTLWDDSIWDVDWSQQWNIFVATYGAPFTRHIISFIYYVYIRFTLVDVGIFLVKYVSSCVYMYKLTKNAYVFSRKMMREKQVDIEDIELQMNIVNTKLSVREAEVAERAQELRRAEERLRYVRARVRDAIAADASLRHMAEMASQSPFDVHESTASNSEDEYISELLTGLKCSYIAQSGDALDFPGAPPDFREIPSNFPGIPSDFPESPSDPQAADADSVYSSITDDSQKSCRIKIVKVTNVYKVAYLRSYIKQKRMRRANRHALLKKKMEGIKKLLENWQKTLNTVINSHLSIMTVDPRRYQLVSQEAMGDYSKPNNAGSDDDSGDIGYDCDDCGPHWARHPYSGDDYPETAHSGDCTETPPDLGDMKYEGSMHFQCECSQLGPGALFVLPEETRSQVAIEEVAGDAPEGEPRPRGF